MRAGWLLALYPRRWRQRYGAEIAGLLSQEPLSARLVIDLVRGAFDAHAHPELAGPVLAAAGGGSMQVPSRSPRIGLFVLVAVFLLFLVFGGLYAYRAQTPAILSVSVTQVISEVQAGHVTAVEFSGAHATITLVDGRREQTTVPATPGEPLSAAVNEYNRTHPTGNVRLDYTSDANPFSYIALPLLSFLITFLPIALLALLILLLARRLTRNHGDAQRAARYEWLAKIADLRDRGVLTDEEFQQEKRRLLE